jgi:predicted porin
MNLRSIDLNLLVILEALVEERSVTKAAQRVGISQSAASHALRRLRITFQDELLVRTADGMSPTAIALSLANAIGGSLHDIEQAVQGGRCFDPATSTHAFKMRVSDYATMYLLPRLCQRLRQSAPSTRLEVKQFDHNDIDQKVTNEEVQVRLALNATGGDETYMVRLLEDRFVILMNSDNPARNSKFTLTDYLELDHLKVSIGDEALRLLSQKYSRRQFLKKKALFVSALLTVASHSSFAQSNVTLYGILSEGVAWVNNDGGHSNVKTLSGPNQNNRVGVRITEDLGDGNHAIAVLENGFDITSGKLQQGGRMFGRQAYVGLSNDQFGAITAGRQYDMFWDYFTPIASASATVGLADHPGDSDNLVGSWRYSNAVKYVSPTFSGVTAEAMYAFSNAAGKFSINRAFGAGIGYDRGPLKLAAAYVELGDPGTLNSSGAVSDDYQGASFLTFRSSPLNSAVGVLKQRNAGFGGRYDFGKGFRVNALVDTVRYTYRDGTSFRLDNYDVSVNYNVRPNLVFGAAYVYSAGKFGGLNANPHWHTVGLSLDYFLSKRTDVFIFNDFQRVSGPHAVAALYLDAPSTSKTQDMVVVGIRHKF